MKNTKRVTLLTYALLAMGIAFGPEMSVLPVIAAPNPNESTRSAPASPTEAAPTGLATIQVGPLEITPSRVNLLLEKEYDKTVFSPTIRFKIKNTSSADIKVILFRYSIQATDDLGYAWFLGIGIMSGGLVLSEQPPTTFAKAFAEEKSRFVTLSPNQIFETQISSTRPIGYPDKDNELIKTHRPKTVTFSANIGIINLDNSYDTRALSFSDVPVQISAR